MIKFALSLAFLGIVALIGGYFYLDHYVHKTIILDDEVDINISKGSNLNTVAKALLPKIDIGSRRLFVKAGQIYGFADKIKFGEYVIPQKTSVHEILSILAKGETKKYQFTFVEGSHVYDLASLLSRNDFGSYEDILSFLKSKENAKKYLSEPISGLEGYLYPDTYFYSKGEKLEDIVGRMVQQFKDVYAEFEKENSGLTRHQNVTLASIIEKETGAGFERPLIASVFFNRMKKGMRLETDPTVMYGILFETGKEIKNIKKIHLKTPTLYNTYTMKGLPPGPIGSPGKAALKAVFRPKKSNHLFFVSRNDGTHVFTDSYDDHLKAVRNFQLNPKARQGKSWRDLKKAQ